MANGSPQEGSGRHGRHYPIDTASGMYFPPCGRTQAGRDIDTAREIIFYLLADTSLPRQRRRQGNQGMCSSGQDKHKNHENYEIRVSRVWSAIIAIIENTCYSFVERLPSEKNEFLRDNS